MAFEADVAFEAVIAFNATLAVLAFDDVNKVFPATTAKSAELA
jgi:2C-methyl-D-erythritol 2,4-cyclodiphosphate synthase